MDDEKQKTILLVEDEKIIALAESSQLQRFGYNVILASSGNQSVEKFKNNINQIDLILMDINLGDGIDGTEAARQILSIKNIPIVFLTSHSEEEYVNKVKEITRYGYIIKNSTDFVLKSSIEMAFELFETNEKLLKNEQRLTFALSGANDGLWDVIMNTNEVYLSKRGCEILGYTEEELPQIAKVWSELVHPDDLPATQDALSAYLDGKKDIFTIEQRLRMKSGEYKWVLARGKAVSYDSEGKPLRMVGTHTDISDRKNEENEAKLKSEIINKLIEGIHLTTINDGIIKYVNESFEKMFGYDHQELIGKHVSILNAITDKKPSEVAQEIINCIKEKGVWKGELLNIKKDKTQFWTRAIVSIINHSILGDIMLTVQEDISEQKQNEDKIKSLLVEKELSKYSTCTR